MEGEMENIKVGDKITLKANEEEGWPEQKAKVIDITQMQWGLSITVTVKPEDRDDDGIREITQDQIK